MPDYEAAVSWFLAFLRAEFPYDEQDALREFDRVLPLNMVEERANARSKAVAQFTRVTYHH